MQLGLHSQRWFSCSLHVKTHFAVLRFRGCSAAGCRPGPAARPATAAAHCLRLMSFSPHQWTMARPAPTQTAPPGACCGNGCGRAAVAVAFERSAGLFLAGTSTAAKVRQCLQQLCIHFEALPAPASCLQSVWRVSNGLRLVSGTY
jgi:hypothetical protein